jgi:hypothetical protein
MNNGRDVSTGTIVAGVTWVLAGVCMLAAWILMWTGHDGAAHMMGFTGCGITGAAAVATMRSYMVRTCALLRTLHRLDVSNEARGAELHSLR